MSKKGLICGRGRSLVHYKQLFNNDFDFIYLVNEFNRFIVEDVQLLQFLKQKSISGYLTQQVNICASGVDSNLLNNINVQEIITTRLKPNSDNVWWRGRVNMNAFMHFNKSLSLQPEIISPYMQHVENSLGVAILNLILDKNCSEVYVIGSDFYEEDYYLSHREYDWEETSKKEVQDKLKKGFDVLIDEFKDVSFKIFTCSSYQNDSDNCQVIKLEV